MKSPNQRLSNLFPLWGSGSMRELPPHRNPGLEIVYVSQGYLRWRIENHVFEPGPGSVFYTFPWELHGSLDEFEPGHRWDFVVLKILRRPRSRDWQIPPALGLSATESRRVLGRLIRSPHRSLAAGERLKWLLPALQRELATKKNANLAMATTLGKAVLIELDLMVAQAASRRIPALPQRPDPCENLLRRFQSDYAEPWNLKTMSQVARLGRTRLGHLIKERTGDSPITYLNRVRVAKAEEFLRHGDRSITDIAFACGFQSSQYFARTFRQLTDRTPREYRTMWRDKMHKGAKA
jgi:AraC-like DNA-binding protein